MNKYDKEVVEKKFMFLKQKDFFLLNTSFIPLVWEKNIKT